MGPYVMSQTTCPIFKIRTSFDSPVRNLSGQSKKSRRLLMTQRSGQSQNVRLFRFDEFGEQNIDVNPRPGGGLSNIRLSEGVILAPRLTRKLRGLERRRKTQLNAHKNQLKLFRSFFAWVKIMNWRDQKRRKLRVFHNCRTSCRKTSIISRTT